MFFPHRLSLTQSLFKAALLRLVVHKSYEGRMGGGGCHCCSASESAAEVVTAPNRHLYERSEAAGWHRAVTFCERVICAGDLKVANCR